MRASASPSTVLRMWPTCIGLATFGEPKSITIRRGFSASGTPSRSSCKSCARLRRDGRRFEREIDETRAGNRRRLAPFRDVELLDDFLRERARIFTALFRENERGVCLVIAEARVGRRHDIARPAAAPAAREGDGTNFSRAAFETFP